MLNPYDRNIFDYTIQTVPNGLLGTNLTFMYSGPGDAELALIQIEFLTDANAADRTLELHWNIGNGYQRLCSSLAVQTATLTHYYTAGHSISAYSCAGGSRIYMPLPAFCRSTQSIPYNLDADNMQAGDQFRNIKLYWIRWIDGL